MSSTRRVPHALRVAVEKLSAQLHCLLERHGWSDELQEFRGYRSMDSVKFDRDTVACAIRFVDELSRIPGGLPEIEQRAAMLTFQPPPLLGRKLIQSLGTIESTVRERHRALKPESIMGLKTSQRIELHEQGFRDLDNLVRFADHLDDVVNQRVRLTPFLLEQFLTSLQDSFTTCDWADEVKAKFEKLQQEAEVFANEVDHVKAEGCLLLRKLSRREQEPMLHASVLIDMQVAIDSLVEWVERESDKSRNATTVGQANEQGETDTKQAKRNGHWQDCDTPRPEEYLFGPLRGKKKDLARWIVPNSKDRDGRALETRLADGSIWGRRTGRYVFEVWFKTSEQYAHANARQLNEQQGTA